jgi:hypothetical protein
MLIVSCESPIDAVGESPDPEAALTSFVSASAEASRESDMTVAATSFIFVLLSIQCV